MCSCKKTQCRYNLSMVKACYPTRRCTPSRNPPVRYSRCRSRRTRVWCGRATLWVAWDNNSCLFYLYFRKFCVFTHIFQISQSCKTIIWPSLSPITLPSLTFLTKNTMPLYRPVNHGHLEPVNLMSLNHRIRKHRFPSRRKSFHACAHIIFQ